MHGGMRKNTFFFWCRTVNPEDRPVELVHFLISFSISGLMSCQRYVITCTIPELGKLIHESHLSQAYIVTFCFIRKIFPLSISKWEIKDEHMHIYSYANKHIFACILRHTYIYVLIVIYELRIKCNEMRKNFSENSLLLSFNKSAS